VWNDYWEDFWGEQDSYVEVWLEKQSLASVFAPICEEFNVRLEATRGDWSDSKVYQASNRLAESSSPSVSTSTATPWRVTMLSKRSAAYRQLTHPATWGGVAFVAAGSIVPLVLYPEHPGVASTTAWFALLCRNPLLQSHYRLKQPVDEDRELVTR